MSSNFYKEVCLPFQNSEMATPEFKQAMQKHEYERAHSILMDTLGNKWKAKISRANTDISKIKKRFENYFRGNGIIVPVDVDDFFKWYATEYPDNNLNDLFKAVNNERNYILFHKYNERLLGIETQNNTEPKSPNQATKQNNKLSDLITHEKSAEIVEFIKVQYKNIKGKRLRLLLLALQDLDLFPKERKSKAFHTACKCEFDWDVASYAAMNNYTYNANVDKAELQKMKEFLQKQIKTN